MNLSRATGAPEKSACIICSVDVVGRAYMRPFLLQHANVGEFLTTNNVIDDRNVGSNPPVCNPCMYVVRTTDKACDGVKDGLEELKKRNIDTRPTAQPGD